MYQVVIYQKGVAKSRHAKIHGNIIFLSLSVPCLHRKVCRGASQTPCIVLFHVLIVFQLLIKYFLKAHFIFFFFILQFFTSLFTKSFISCFAPPWILLIFSPIFQSLSASHQLLSWGCQFHSSNRFFAFTHLFLCSSYLYPCFVSCLNFFFLIHHSFFNIRILFTETGRILAVFSPFSFFIVFHLTQAFFQCFQFLLKSHSSSDKR